MLKEAKGPLPDAVIDVIAASFGLIDELAEHADKLPPDLVRAAHAFEAILNEHFVVVDG